MANELNARMTSEGMSAGMQTSKPARSDPVPKYLPSVHMTGPQTLRHPVWEHSLQGSSLETQPITACLQGSVRLKTTAAAHSTAGRLSWCSAPPSSPHLDA